MQQQKVAVTRAERFEDSPHRGDPFITQQGIVGGVRGVVRLLPPRACRESLAPNARAPVIDRQASRHGEEPRWGIVRLFDKEAYERFLRDILSVVGAPEPLPSRSDKARIPSLEQPSDVGQGHVTRSARWPAVIITSVITGIIPASRRSGWLIIWQEKRDAAGPIDQAPGSPAAPAAVARFDRWT
jgi:hypothetical protein